ncbi:SAM-dependent methyltransferase [Undibacterium pigrum]|uniref:Tetrapyrrole (Corrin/porphyrin) methylase-like protein n=1 Tax=Undibacterium pigrum TaxID=401470 RepID=A0A318IWR0_9BURK|nr:SAM-dependent methyltransferase [Undibacterium pigrum]PXX39755.1 tetrapyrrole (corrin/porphyrin) methylase-like protein [Undibacterium pigrum]
MTNQKQGSLVCVGTGMRMAGQLTPIAQSYMESFDIVIAAVPNIFTRKWLQGVAREYVCLNDHYEDTKVDGKTRRDTYRRMADTILKEVRAGKKVCAAFYGHPGIFACISHMAIAEAREEGYDAHMEPGISALDCLVADLGIDPGSHGMQSMESTQFMIYKRTLDPTALLVLWQVGIAGDLTLKRFDTESAHLQILVNKLAQYYPLDHEVILYEAATDPLEKTRIDKLPLGDLPKMSYKQITTLVIPPAQTLEKDQAIIDELNALAALRAQVPQAA